LIDGLKLDRFVLFGTSLGGLMTMLLALRDSKRIAAALLNDVGPDLNPQGMERLRGFVGRSQSWPTWLHAARHFAAANRKIYPKWKVQDWLVFAKRLCRLNQSGRIVLDYDMRIAEPFKAGGAVQFDMWSAFAALRDVPTLVVHGARSDILAPETLARMRAQQPKLATLTIPNIGHAPTLEEPEAVEAIDRLLASLDARSG
jgi:pimeloyl-ACP methyl ester carboxylesterase